MAEVGGIINAINIAFRWQIPKALEHSWHAFFHVPGTNLEHEGSNDFIFLMQVEISTTIYEMQIIQPSNEIIETWGQNY